jgi:hypothetical protein
VNCAPARSALVARTVAEVRPENSAAEDTELEEDEIIKAHKLDPAEQARILPEDCVLVQRS